jgi:hypothetical protein
MRGARGSVQTYLLDLSSLDDTHDLTDSVSSQHAAIHQCDTHLADGRKRTVRT